MFRALLIVLVVVVAAAALMFFNTMPQRDPITQQMEQPGDGTDLARTHISQLTSGANQAIDIQGANNFVTGEQLISLPEKKVTAAADIEQVSTQNTTDSGASATYAVPADRLDLGTATDRIRSQSQPMNLNQVRLKELLDDPNAKDKIFYIHAVNEGDREGLWGIMQHALMRSFTQGMALPGRDNKVYAEIPGDADERLQDQSSSFLGSLLQNKVERTYIYNYEKGILGDNPDLIQPGQQLIIVTFTENELVNIYNHFANR